MDETKAPEDKKARCTHCRSEIVVPATYAHGDHIKCGSCGTQHKVSRSGESVRVVVADVAPLRDALRTNEGVIERLEDEISGARRSFGIGVNGLGIGLIYFLVQVALQDAAITTELIVRAVGIGLTVGALLELANFLFLAKRQKIRRLTHELDEARAEGRQLQKLIREAGRM